MPAPSALDYARHHGLVRQPSHPIHSIKHLRPYDIEATSVACSEIFDQKELISAERLELSREGMLFLSNATRPPFAPRWDEVLDAARERRRMKCELPVLSRDHEKDLRWFRSGINVDKLLRQLEKETLSVPDSKDDYVDGLRAASAAVHNILQRPHFELGRSEMTAAMEYLKRSSTNSKPVGNWDMPERVKVDTPKRSLRIITDAARHTRRGPKPHCFLRTYHLVF